MRIQSAKWTGALCSSRTVSEVFVLAVVHELVQRWTMQFLGIILVNGRHSPQQLHRSRQQMVLVGQAWGILVHHQGTYEGHDMGAWQDQSQLAMQHLLRDTGKDMVDRLLVVHRGKGREQLKGP